ncbi:MAG: shikimate kinase [Verrucomicrobia bacterium]|nr:MAG: shikimate kinase [Verrucomicrobiota bacterium]
MISFMEPRHSNIVLIGFMGCGKSSIGRRLASSIGYTFTDSDDLITERHGRSISEIFASQGEEIFRNLETEELRGLTEHQNIVLATGGGAILRKENRELLHLIGRVVWLHANPETLFTRASRNRKRPLLEVENPRSTFNSLLESRLPVYEEAADLKIDATGLSHEQTLEEILDRLGFRSDARRSSGTNTD